MCEEFLTIYRYNDIIEYKKKENPNFKTYTENELIKYYNYKETK